jgi:hypothetical protein
MTLTEKGNSTIHCIGEIPGEKVHHHCNIVDAGSNGGNVNQHKQTEVEIDSNSADHLHWRCPQCSCTNDVDISSAVFGDTIEGARLCVICYTSCPCEVNFAGKVGCRHVETRVKTTDMCLSGQRVADMSANMTATQHKKLSAGVPGQHVTACYLLTCRQYVGNMRNI